MKRELHQDDRREYSPIYRRRPRGPRFGLIVLIIMAILSVVIALIVAYIFT